MEGSCYILDVFKQIDEIGDGFHVGGSEEKCVNYGAFG